MKPLTCPENVRIIRHGHSHAYRKSFMFNSDKLAKTLSKMSRIFVEFFGIVNHDRIPHKTDTDALRVHDSSVADVTQLRLKYAKISRIKECR